MDWEREMCEDMYVAPRPSKPGELTEWLRGLVEKDGPIRDEYLRISRIKKRRVYTRRRSLVDAKHISKANARKEVFDHGHEILKESNRLFFKSQERRGIEKRVNRFGEPYGKRKTDGLIAANGACTVCVKRPISVGSSSIATSAHAHDLCIWCERGLRSVVSKRGRKAK